MNAKKILMQAARKPSHKKEVNRMSDAEARQVLSKMDLSFDPLTDEQRQAVEWLKKHKEDQQC